MKNIINKIQELENEVRNIAISKRNLNVEAVRELNKTSGSRCLIEFGKRAAELEEEQARLECAINSLKELQ